MSRHEADTITAGFGVQMAETSLMAVDTVPYVGRHRRAPGRIYWCPQVESWCRNKTENVIS